MPMDKQMESLLERLNDAFDGICVFYEDYSCCKTCGHAEAEAEAKRMIEDENDYSYCNYVFYHQQNTADLNKGEKDVYLAHNLDKAATIKMLDLIEEWSDYIYWNGKHTKAIYVTCDPDRMASFKRIEGINKI